MSKQILGPKLGYVDMLDVRTQAANDKEAASPVTRSPLRPSAAGKCARELAYNYAEYKGLATYAKEALAPTVTRTFALGHSVEYVLLQQIRQYCSDLVQVKYTQQGLTFMRLLDGTILEGSLDAVFYSKEQRAIIDVKSKKDKFSNHYSSNWDETSDKLSKLESLQQLTDTTFYADDLPAFLDELNDPFFADNFLQLNLYACNPFITERGIDHAAIIQFNKNDCRLREVRFRPSQDLYDKILAKFKEVDAKIVGLQGPESVEKEFTLGSIKCAFCNYKSECWPKNNATKDFWRSMPDKKWPKDLDRMGDDGKQIELLVTEWACLKAFDAKATAAEQRAILAIQKAGISKFRLTDGSVYEIKVLSNSISLRRSKI